MSDPTRYKMVAAVFRSHLWAGIHITTIKIHGSIYRYRFKIRHITNRKSMKHENRVFGSIKVE